MKQLPRAGGATTHLMKCAGHTRDKKSCPWNVINPLALTVELTRTPRAFASHLGKWADGLSVWDVIDMDHAGEFPDFEKFVARGGFFEEEMMDVLPDHACLYRSVLVLMIQAVCVHDVVTAAMTEERFKRYYMLMCLVARGSVWGDMCERATRHISM